MIHPYACIENVYIYSEQFLDACSFLNISGDLGAVLCNQITL